MMFFDGNMAAPPTMTVFSWAPAGATIVAVRARAPKATAESRAIRLDMENLPIGQGRADIRGLEGCNDDVSLTAASLAGATGGFCSRFRRNFFSQRETIGGPRRGLSSLAPTKHLDQPSPGPNNLSVQARPPAPSRLTSFDIRRAGCAAKRLFASGTLATM